MIRIYHYRQKCIGCNACVEAKKDRWRMSRKDGKSTLVGGKNTKGIYRTEIENDEYKSIMEAEKNCPVKIIKIEKLS
ncbi:MAG: ferredoxin [Bacteroidetes bacterium]|nr:MAG: ferredoxin [Bacteroidota bacterium]